MARERHIRVQRSARWFELGEAGPSASEIWIVLHGYGQLARDFVATFEPIAGAGRLVLAPEALSRFYATGDRPATHRDSPVGASWMTREDRDAEILDYVDYLDAVAARARAAAPSAGRLVAFGFSQGTATASRWAALGAAAIDRLVLWGGAPADDVPVARLVERLGGRPVELVHGAADRVVPAAYVRSAAERLTAEGAPVSIREFDGGHRIDAGVLASIAG